jgi:hypothetical protein
MMSEFLNLEVYHAKTSLPSNNGTCMFGFESTVSAEIIGYFGHPRLSISIHRVVKHLCKAQMLTSSGETRNSIDDPWYGSYDVRSLPKSRSRIMSHFGVRNTFCWMMIAMFPASLMASESNSAMLYAKGTAWINGSAVPHSSALFAGDMVQTRPDSMVNINALGSNVTVGSDSLIKYQGNAISVEHGSISVATSKGLVTHIGEVTVAPTQSSWTEFEVTDVNGSVQIMARKGDVTIADASGTNTLPQGQQATRDESQDQKTKKHKKNEGAVAPMNGGILDSPWAIGLGAGAIGVGAAIILTRDGDPISPKSP